MTFVNLLRYPIGDAGALGNDVRRFAQAPFSELSRFTRAGRGAPAFVSILTAVKYADTKIDRGQF